MPRAYQFLEAVPTHVVDDGNHPLMYAAMRLAIERMRWHLPYVHTTIGRQPEDISDAPAVPLCDAQLPDTTGAQGLEHRIEAVDDHRARTPHVGAGPIRDPVADSSRRRLTFEGGQQRACTFRGAHDPANPGAG